LVCHYIDEVPEAQKEFPNSTIHYHYDAKEYFALYKSFDLVVGHRVHGIGLAASSGIPGILISHDLRGDTGIGFKAAIFSVDSSVKDILDEIEKLKNSATEKNQALIDHKRKTFDEYISLVKAKASFLNNSH
jgi:polysaccharide pyruvyl transferase WcaK-like protein